MRPCCSGNIRTFHYWSFGRFYYDIAEQMSVFVVDATVFIISNQRLEAQVKGPINKKNVATD